MENNEKPTSRFQKKYTLVQAISLAIANGAGVCVVGAQEPDIAPTQSQTLDEIFVTARKRTEGLQDVPQSVLAFSESDIERYGFLGADDYSRFIPGLTISGGNPGEMKIIFRGVADSSSTIISDPSAAIYLDEQPITLLSDSPEVRLVDIERIEALSGPQATLYGASSQSGTIRIITNKPNVDEFEGNVGVSTHVVDQGEAGYDVDATVNIPLVKEKLAIRLVGFHAKDGGFIDNVLGTSPTAETRDNADLVEGDFNDVEWLGGRAALKWQVNDKWSATAAAAYQKLEADGRADYDPTVGDLQDINFFEEITDDEWYQASATIEGDVGFAQILSSTSYFNREVKYTRDNTNYAAYFNFDSAYSAVFYPQYNLYDLGPDPLSFNNFDSADERISHEIRLSHEGSRWKWTAGFFYQHFKQKWRSASFIPGYRDTVAFEAWNNICNGAFFPAFRADPCPDNLGPLPVTDSWFANGEDVTRDDFAVFGEVTFSATDKLDLIFGGRWYDLNIDRTYFVARPATRLEDVASPSGSDTGFLPKGALQYNIDDDKMIYVLYSQGFRTGGINRGRGNPTLPQNYDSDKLINYEAGLRTEWFDQRLRLNVTGYHQVWKDYQLEVLDPSFFVGELFQTVVANVGDSVINGVDFEFAAVPLDGMEIGANGSYLIKNETNEDFFVSDPRAPDLATLNLPKGTRLPLVADLNLSAYLNYTWPVSFVDGEAFFRFQYSYTGESLNKVSPDPEPFPQLIQEEYHIGDVKIGLATDDWRAEFFVNNVWDERAEFFRSVGRLDRFWGHDRIITVTPRTFGLRIRKTF